MGIEITFMNQSYDANYQVVLFPQHTTRAWKVLSSPAYSHTFHYPADAIPFLCIGVATGIKEGEEITTEILNSIHTIIPLTGIVKANLIMSGGGLREPYRFTLLPR